jgi:hypothetical protein
MAFLIGGANSAADTGFDIDNSLRFNSADEDHLDLTDPPGNNYYSQFTFSFWVKRCKLASEQFIVQSSAGNATSFTGISFNSSDQLVVQLYDSTDDLQVSMITNRLFRDISAWYNIIVCFDLNDGTTADRIKIYVNGTRETSFATSTIPGAGFQSACFIDSADPLYIGRGRNTSGSTVYSGFYLAQFLCVTPDSGDSNGENADAELTPSDVGEFDEDSPTIWKPKEIDPAVLGASLDMSDNLGTNGFFLDFADSANLGNDANGGTDWDENNIAATNSSTDTPTNNFATWNSVIKTTAALVEGNLKYTTPGSNPVYGSHSTIGVTAGKWYAELNYTSGASHKLVLGVADDNFQNGLTTGTYDIGKSGTADSIAYVVNTGDYRINNSNTSWGSGGGDGNIINMAMDRDNGKLYFGVDGTWGNSSDPAAGSNGIPTTALDSSAAWFFGITSDTSGTGDVGEINFGNPSYANSSDAADANGYGAFEYAPPSGYYALCTKNLATYG